MLKWTEALNSYDKVRFIRDERFLESKGIGPDRYWVGPSSEMPSATRVGCPVVIGYNPEGYLNGSVSATISLSMCAGSVALHTTLPQATAFLTCVFDSPDFLETILSSDPDKPAGDALIRFGLDPAKTLKPNISQYRPDTYLAPTRNGWQLYLVEPNGEIVPLAYCAKPAPLAYLFASQIEQQRTDLGERVAAFIPHNAAAIIRGKNPTL